MAAQNADPRSDARRVLDEQIASAPLLPPLQLPSDAKPVSIETHLGKLRRPLAVAGVVENGMVRPIDPSILLPEHARVIIVASELT